MQLGLGHGAQQLWQTGNIYGRHGVHLYSPWRYAPINL
jgi:hypothetical protein